MPNFRTFGIVLIASLPTLAVLGATSQSQGKSHLTRLSPIEASRVDGGAPCQGITTKFGEDNGCEGKCKVQNNTIDAGGVGNSRLETLKCYEPEGNQVQCGSLVVGKIKCN